MLITIPSYQRAGKVTTLDFLCDAFKKEEIVIGTQTMEDYEAYMAAYGERATIIYKEGHSCGDNRNNLLEWCQENGFTETLQLDDDIRYIITMHYKKLRGEEFRALMEQCFDMCRNKNVVMWGAYCCTNHLMMSRTAKRDVIVGMLIGLMDCSFRFDRSFKVKSDYELSLRIMTQGKRVVRFNSFAPVPAAINSGGCVEAYKSPEYCMEADLLVEAYPNLVKHHPTKKGEIKFIG